MKREKRSTILVVLGLTYRPQYKQSTKALFPALLYHLFNLFRPGAHPGSDVSLMAKFPGLKDGGNLENSKQRLIC